MSLTVDSSVKLNFFSHSEFITLLLFAETVVNGEQSGAATSALAVASNIDRYMSYIQSRKRWRIKLLLRLIEWTPVIFGLLPFSMMSSKRRFDFVNKYIREGRGFFWILAKGRQLVYMGYYADINVAQRIGYRSFEMRKLLIPKKRNKHIHSIQEFVL